ncbi:MAG: glycosyltransferase [Candidatus Omnitrophica bacterium]|nr:glycosyltransferase [Candidatus Omnitrophota bacterium]
MNPEVSVIIPTYNRAETLPRAIRSVLAQEGVPFELIVVDDGSSDNTREMIQKDFPSVTYLYQDNKGPAAARNLGVKNAKGRWIAFLDSDDEWLPGKLEIQLGFFRQHPEYRIAQTEEIWIRNGERVNPMKKHQKSGGRIFEKCLPLCVISPSAVMMERDLFEETGGFDESYPACEDYELWLRISVRHPVGLIHQPMIKKYGGHESQRSREFEAMDRFRIHALAKILGSGTLDNLQHQAALKTLKMKSEIFLVGAQKRSKFEEAEKIRRLVKEFLG